VKSFSRPIQWYHTHADPIWPDSTFKLFKAKQKRKPWFYKYLGHAEIFPRYFQFSGGGSSPLPPPPPPLPYKGGELKETEDSSPSTCIDSQGGVFNSSGSFFLPVIYFLCWRIFCCGVKIAKTIFF
jgi:hypothetical protein